MMGGDSYWYDPRGADAFGAPAACGSTPLVASEHVWHWRGDRLERVNEGDRIVRRLTAIRFRCGRCGWWRVLDVATLRERVQREEP